jgi:hypothetical protein
MIDCGKTDRRAGRRFPAGQAGVPLTCRLRPGPEVRVVNLSSIGALVEGTFRLRPGSIVAAAFGAPPGERVAKCRVTRCVVAALGGVSGISYQAGLAFEAPQVIVGTEHGAE